MAASQSLPGRHSLLRLGWLLPPAALLLAGAAMLIVTPFAWGAAEHVEIPAWMTAFVALLFALPALAIGAVGVRQVERNTRSYYDLYPLHLFGAVILVLVAALELALAARIADPSTYDSLRDSRGEVTVSPAGFLAVTVWPSIVAAIFTAASAYTYAEGFQEKAPSRFDKAADEVDAIGEMLKRRS